MNIISFFQTHETFLVGFLLAQLLLVVVLAIKYVHDKTSALDASGTAKKLGVLELLMLVVIPSFSAFAFVYVTFVTIGTKPVANTKSKAAQTSDQMVPITTKVSVSKQVATAWETLLKEVPTNPTEVTATASGKELTSGASYPYSTVTLTWSGAQAREPGTSITGYYVYFGPKNTEIPFPQDGYKDSVDPKNMGVLVQGTSYTATKLTRGQTYYLYVQSVTNSTNVNLYYKYGLVSVGYLQTLSATKLFTYTYQ